MRYPSFKVLAAAAILSSAAALGAEANAPSGDLPGYSAPQTRREAAKVALTMGLGYESETGLPWAIEPRLGLDVAWARSYAKLELSQAFGELSPSGSVAYRFLDTAAISVGYLLWRPERASLRLEAFSRYRSFGSIGLEARFGGLALLEAGRAKDEAGFSFRGAAGFSRLMTRYSSIAVTQWDNDPLARLGFAWRSAGGLSLDAAVSDYTGSDASLWLKTFFDFGASYELEGATLEARLVLKYSDFFTLTSYLDGAALRLALRLPLGDLPWPAELTGR
jgi:hypothetical protein